uniref:Uncharacterized protein n=1 Tax=Vitis vinifera TaxID=29760 RepID=A5AMQ2_VITVI|nr:hypothetical protein VITISV_013843 [Vitis vinifera]
MLSTAASLYPLYVTAGGVVACVKPSVFAWFVEKGPASYSLSLGLIMLSMGITLKLRDFFNLLIQRPFSVYVCNLIGILAYVTILVWRLVVSNIILIRTMLFFSTPDCNGSDIFGIVVIMIAIFLKEKVSAILILFGCVAQYTIMPSFGLIISKALGLSPSLTVGLILLACCPGGTASNVVTLIARGDVPLSIVMTICTTFGAVLLTPLLTKILAGAYVPVNAANLSISTLQVVVGPILLGSYIQSRFPELVKAVTPFAPLFAVLASSLLACSVFSENVVRLKSSMVSASLASDVSPLLRIQSLLSGELGLVILSVLLLHFAGFFVGYTAAAIAGFGERQRRAISVEVGMQNSSLGVVLATSHFPSPMVALPPAMSAVIMNIMGSSLGFFWRYIDPSDSKNNPKADGSKQG